MSLLIVYAFYLPHLAIAAADIDAAVQDFCKCGFPPSAQCMDALAKKYPEIDKSSELQGRVMSKAKNDCVSGSRGAEDSIQDMVGNPNLDPSTLPAGIATALDDIHKLVSSTQNCSTDSFTIAVPKNWQCRKQRKNAKDVTLYTNGNKLNVSVGVSQGRTSCTVIPNCSSEDFELSENFDTKVYTNPMLGTYEYAGVYKKDNVFKLTITSNTRPTKAQLGEIKVILDSFETR